MLRTALFLAGESLLFTTVLIVSWLVIKRALALLGAQLGHLALWAPIALWAMFLVVNITFTRVYGPSFTALYRVSGFVLAGSLALLVFCLIVSRTRPSRVEPS